MKSILVLLAVMLSFAGLAQDKIMLLSGKVLDGKILAVDTAGIHYQYSKKGKTREVLLDSYRIYSVEYSDGKSVVIYERDSVSGRNYTIKQMGAFVEGERYAFDHFNGTGIVIYSIATGLIAGSIAPGIGIFSAPLAIAFGLAPLIPPPKKINPAEVVDKELLTEKYFLEGYSRVIRSKRLGRGLISAVGAAAVGAAVALLTN